MHALWTMLLYRPLVNILMLIMSTVSFGDIGVAVIILTILVKLVLFPLTKRSIISQVKMKAIEPEMAKIKAKYPAKEEQAKKTFELYKKNGVNPFSGCLLVILQLPIILALYYVFLHGLADAPTLLYSFVHIPANMSTSFLGLADITKPNIVFAILAALAQFFQLQLSASMAPAPKIEGAPVSFKDDLARNMTSQMKYVLPVMILLVGLRVSAAVALYWIVSNMFTMLQERSLRGVRNEPVIIVS